MRQHGYISCMQVKQPESATRFASQAGSRTCEPPAWGIHCRQKTFVFVCLCIQRSLGTACTAEIVRTDDEMLSGANGRLSSSAVKASPRSPSALLWARADRIVRMMSSSLANTC